MSYSFTKASLLTGTIMAGAMIAAPAVAQEDVSATVEAAEIGTPIVVTGSRIARRNVETAAPVAVVSNEEFELSGTVNVENVINTLPQVIPGTTSFSNNPGDGAATLNLRGLGSNRTLVLVNGRRWMFYDTSQVVDLNTIPSFLLDSVDVVTGGASAVYGSDALAGVVNFRLRDVDGIELGGQYSITEHGDGARYQVHGAIGTSFDDGRGSATVYGEYYRRKDIFQGDRDFSYFANWDGDGELIPGGSSTLPSGVMRYYGGANGNGTATGTEFGAATGASSAVVFDVPGDFRNRVGTDLYNYAPVNYLQLPQERYLIGGYADYEISGGHKAYAEVAYVNNRVAQELAATPVTGDFNLNLAAIEDFLTPADFAQLQQIDASETAANLADGEVDDPGIVNMYLQRRTVETGARNSLDERNAFRVLAGMTGPISDYISYDAYYSYARTRNANVQQGNISRSAFQAGLDGSADAINIFGPNTLTPGMVDQISILAQNGDVSTLQVATAAISGTFGDFAIGGGDPVGFAFGAEYRKVGSEFIPDTALSSGDVIGFNAGEATAGSYNVKELFAELNVPIEFGSARLELSGAARYSDYSLDAVGGVWTYAGGVEFAPIPDVILRGQYQRAIRAPNVAELYAGQSIGFPSAEDPCAQPEAATDAAIRDICIATGVPAAQVGQPGLQLNSQIAALFGGNPDLEEETSESWTAGIVLQPSFARGLTITADYYDIRVENAIATAGGGLANSLALCYEEVQDVNSVLCQTFVGVRNAGGSFTADNPPLISQANIAALEVAGLDVEVSYSTPVGFALFSDGGESDLNFSFLGTWTRKNNFQPIADLENVNECAGKFGLTCGEPTPKYKWTTRMSWSDGPVLTSIRWRHLNSVKDDEGDFFVVNKIPSYDVFDLAFAFDVSEALTMNMGVNNIFDKKPLELGDNQEQANTYPSTYDVLGRDFFVSASLKF